jgi:hypothetical protein
VPGSGTAAGACATRNDWKLSSRPPIPCHRARAIPELPIAADDRDVSVEAVARDIAAVVKDADAIAGTVGKFGFVLKPQKIETL